MHINTPYYKLFTHKKQPKNIFGRLTNFIIREFEQCQQIAHASDVITLVDYQPENQF